MKKELEILLQPANLDLDWRDLKTRPAGEIYSEMIVVTLKGACDPQTPAIDEPPGALASSAVSGDRVLPFVEIQCNRINRFLEGSLVGEPAFRKDFLTGRAMARILAHEIYHILGQAQSHSETGVAKPCFRRRDLLSNQFVFDEKALAAIRRPVANPALTDRAELGYSAGSFIYP